MSNKNILKESISQTVYHFCPLSSMLQIAETDSFKLSSTFREGEGFISGGHESDIRMNSIKMGNGEVKTYPYYMCFSRTPSTLVGYQLMRIMNTKHEWVNSLVRIKINGNIINQRYKGAPVNFFTEKDPDSSTNLGQKYKDARKWEIPYIPSRNSDIKGDRLVASKGYVTSKEMPRINPDVHTLGRPKTTKYGFSMPKVDYAELVRNRLSEYEDRVFSFKERIPFAHKYIERIDIYVTKKTLQKREVVASIVNIISRYGANKVFIYTNKIAFNSENIRSIIDKKTDISVISSNDIIKYYSEAFNTKDFFKSEYNNREIYYKLEESDIKPISYYIAAIAFEPNFTEESFVNNVKYICDSVGLSNWRYYDGKIINYTPTIVNQCVAFLNNNFAKDYETYYGGPQQNIGNFTRRNSGKKSLIRLYEKITKIGNDECERFAKTYNRNVVSIWSTLANKYKIYRYYANN